MSEYGLATLLEELKEGDEFSSDNWPAHITQIDTFEVNLTEQELILILVKSLNNSRILTSKVIAEEMFGPDKDIPVFLLKKTPNLEQLHQSIVSSLKKIGAKFKRPFILEENYRPHITHTSGLNLRTDDEITIKSISLIDKNSSTKRRVINNIRLH
jgi:2'-5' RNA ligase